MKLLRAATLTTPDPEATAARYAEWFDYSVVDRGVVDAGLAASWGCPGSAGKAYVVAQPASGADVYLRFVQGDGHPDYRPLRTFGWAAVLGEVMAVAAVLLVLPAVLPARRPAQAPVRPTSKPELAVGSA